MKTLKAFIVVVLFSLVPNVVVAEPRIPLTCKGVFGVSIDMVTSGNKKPVTVEVFLDLEDSTMEIKGDWGCLGDIGNPEMSWRPPRFKCIGLLPVEITEEKVDYTIFSEDERYSNLSGFVLNRYSGTLTVSGVATAKPNSGAK